MKKWLFESEKYMSVEIIYFTFQTVVLDGSRIFELRDRLVQVCLMGTVILITLSSLGPVLPQADAFKIRLKKNICGILDPAYTQK